MLSLTEKLLFLFLTTVSLFYAWLGFERLYRLVASGQPHYYPRFNEWPRRIFDALVRTITQVTVFRDRPVVSFFHSFIFYGFVFYGLVNLADLAAVGPHGWFEDLSFGAVGNLFRLGTDIFGSLVLIGVVFFVIRRWGTGDRRLSFNENTLLHPDVRAGGIRRDSAIVAGFIFLHVGFRLIGTAAQLATHGETDPWQPAASLLARVLGVGRDWAWLEHVGWWGALGLILAFLPYFPRSKHIHIFMAPVKFVLNARTDDGMPVARGALEPVDLEDETAEQFGVANFTHYKKTQLLDAYACIQCNRCNDACPAQTTGKSLSPSALEINKRYELNRIIEPLTDGDKSQARPVGEILLTDEALWACTSCGACVEICPVGCEQLSDIIDIRRDRVMTQGEFPQLLNNAFRGMERAGNPWGISQDKREEWKEGLAVPVPTVEENPDFEVLYWVGCAGAYDPAAQKTARAMAEILNHARVNFAILGKSEKCTGDPARRAGNEYLYYQLATENVETLNAALIDEKLDPKKSKRVVTHCPHCLNALVRDYPQLGGNYQVVHHTQLIEELIHSGRLPEMIAQREITYHDPCYLGRHNGIYDSPRNILTNNGGELTELPRQKNNAFCCGAGGAQFWKEEEPGREKVSENRYKEAEATGAKTIAAGCPFCKSMLQSTPSAGKEGAPVVMDVAELVAENLRRVKTRLASTNA